MSNQKSSPARRRALLVGCQGGVGRAVLAVLAHTDRGRELRKQLDGLFLVDARTTEYALPPAGGVLLPSLRIGSADDLMRLVREHKITEVIDLSSIDTPQCAAACDAASVNFMCTSVEEWPRPVTLPTDEAIGRLLPPQQPQLPNASHIVGTGANPGIVNALMFAALREFASRVGVEPTVEALDLHAALITEEDTTEDTSQPDDDNVFAMTWSPDHCLEELFETRAFAARGGRVEGLGHRPTERWYRVRCGETLVEGMVVPHEEVVTLARMFSTVEVAFVYRIPRVAREALMKHPERKSAADWTVTRRMYPPETHSLTGEDRVGVLLCSRRFGELWMGFRTTLETSLAIGTNATQLQVAAGVLAGWNQLGSHRGIHFIEDLDWRAFLEVAEAVLGPPLIVHDPGAPHVPLLQRAVRSS